MSKESNGAGDVVAMEEWISSEDFRRAVEDAHIDKLPEDIEKARWVVRYFFDLAEHLDDKLTRKEVREQSGGEWLTISAGRSAARGRGMV